MSNLDDYEGDTASDHKRLSELITDQLEELARAIHSRDQLVRARAASRLVNLNVDPDLALPALTHPRPMVREVAAEAIGYSQKPLSPMVIDTLLAAIDDPKTFVAAAAIRTLGRRQVSTAREQISACLDDPEPPIVAAAIVALARLGDHTLASVIPDSLNSPHLVIRIAAAEAAGLLHVSAAIPGLLRFLEECMTAWHTTQQHIPSRAASVAMQSLARLQARSAVPLLIEIARYVVGLRTLAVRTLIQLHAVEAAPALIPLLNEEGSHLLNEVIRFFHTVDYRPAAPALRNVLERAMVRHRALIKKLLTILVEWRDEQSIPLISHIAANDPSAEIRHYATRCLAAFHQPSSLSTTAGHDCYTPTIALPTLDNERLQRRRQRLAQLRIEQVVEGTVLRVLRYGAVIDVGGVEGFVHVGEIDWRWIGDARHTLQPGQMVRAIITDIDEERLRVNLSIRRLSPDPWHNINQRFTVGMQVSGIVTGITGFGLFIELAPGVQGLAHISHIPPDQQPLPQKFVLGREVHGVILSIDNERRRIALSLYTELQQKTV
ncbi:S1 RNA-binding domain-containing protein [Chloroflexus sp. Y-396-1]|uniref:S1 RNA-binding domain-containing protein n=1 Tax=Chloroflexus sp. Y-396-1 TaxID=867845 RepID=UPI00048F9813|nr:S1 RNA-binding domain-containing protein [Chloroflexus sp. Y-396-1]